MPILFIILGQRLNLPLTLTTAPLHLLAHYARPGVGTYNIEATSGGGLARDDWYRTHMPMSDRAVESGLYLRTHTPRETVAEMATTVLDTLMAAGRSEEAIAVADAILAVDPKEGYAMTSKGTAISQIMQAEFFALYLTADKVPAWLVPRFKTLQAANEQAFARAEALGWKETK